MLAGMMAVVSGGVCILAGVARLGFVTELLSKPIRYGYMNGIALTVLISQLPKFFGFSIDGEGPLRKLWAIGGAILSGRANWIAFAIGAGTLAIILLLKNSKRLPGILIGVISATAIAGAFDLATRADVSVLGPLPQGLPAFAIPWISYADIVPVLIGGCAVAIVSFADTSVLSRAYAVRTGTHVDPNQEMVGLGVANLAAGFFQGFPISSSSSSCGGPNAVNRNRRRSCRCSLVVGSAKSTSASARRRLGCSGDCRSYRLVRGHRPNPNFSHSTVGVLAIYSLLRGCRRLWCYSRHRLGDRDRCY
jgi:MFS superfamily sulfate permease-like transporter